MNPLCLNLLAFNISSIPLHLDSCIELCINVTNRRYDVIGFCETRLNDTICKLFSIEGCDKYFSNKNTHGGGVAIYLCKSFLTRVLSNLAAQVHNRYDISTP